VTLELWQRVKKVFQGVLDLHASEHPLFLDQACADDSELDRRVQAFLSSDRNVGKFLATPAIDRPEIVGPGIPPNPCLLGVSPDGVSSKICINRLPSARSPTVRRFWTRSAAMMRRSVPMWDRCWQRNGSQAHFSRIPSWEGARQKSGPCRQRPTSNCYERRPADSERSL
jgi:hypothetical protein